ncbi:MFS transporter, putative [Paecilomyces variotii No. 5]|uniref:MFS transporter, putative n=1 Tax=Byssochlamys spectabilis (strain No. 5 / NBRC 109023) TaxID=1356009 RepID=V5FNM7_BYSSN|nr:MFS transporter, putative [Paecilomyces variotii No. 5]
MTVSKEIQGTQWRSSKKLVVVCIAITFFNNAFLYSFVVPILNYMLRERLQTNPIHSQFYTTVILALYALVSMIASPVIGKFADRHPARKGPMLLSLVLAFMGTALFAFSHSLWLLLFARIMQGTAASAIRVIGLATVADRVGEDDIGKAMGTVNSFISAGCIVGPVVSGFLFELLGYWPAWAAPFGVLVLDLIACLLIVESPRDKAAPSQSSYSSCSSETVFDVDSASVETTETRPLLSDNGSSYHSFPESIQYQDDTLDTPDPIPVPRRSFYHDILRSGRVVTALVISALSVFISSSFDATLPLHMQETFHWGTSATGLMFFCLQSSILTIGPLSGWLYDAIGPKYPITVSLICLIPLVWLLGVPGDPQFSWADGELTGPCLCIAAIIGIGVITPFFSGIGTLELTAFIKERQIENPQSYGPNGDFSRTYALNDFLATVSMAMGPIISGALCQLKGYYHMNLVFVPKATMAIPLTVNCVRPTIRHFSAHRPRPDTRASRFVASSCIVSAVVLPFIPPAIESSREKSLGYPNHNK